MGLVIKVSDSSLAADRALADTYIGAEIPVYWVVNIPGRSLDVYTRAERQVIPEGETAELLLDGLVVARIAIVDLLPRRGA